MGRELWRCWGCCVVSSRVGCRLCAARGTRFEGHGRGERGWHTHWRGVGVGAWGVRAGERAQCAGEGGWAEPEGGWALRARGVGSLPVCCCYSCTTSSPAVSPRRRAPEEIVQRSERLSCARGEGRGRGGVGKRVRVCGCEQRACLCASSSPPSSAAAGNIMITSRAHGAMQRRHEHGGERQAIGGIQALSGARKMTERLGSLHLGCRSDDISPEEQTPLWALCDRVVTLNCRAGGCAVMARPTGRRAECWV